MEQLTKRLLGRPVTVDDGLEAFRGVMFAIPMGLVLWGLVILLFCMGGHR
jgi:hypothetical protein